MMILVEETHYVDCCGSVGDKDCAIQGREVSPDILRIPRNDPQRGSLATIILFNHQIIT